MMRRPLSFMSRKQTGSELGCRIDVETSIVQWLDRPGVAVLKELRKSSNLRLRHFDRRGHQ